MEEASSQVL
jgi:hypothetical protein